MTRTIDLIVEKTNISSIVRPTLAQEDRQLLRAMGQASSPLKWPDVARLVPNRSGKQCRERYFNHLMPSVKLSEWSPAEDAAMCHLYSKLGSKWATIARMLPGRSDNNVKNRFHYIRRQLEKCTSHIYYGSLATTAQMNSSVLQAAMSSTTQEDWAQTIASAALCLLQTDEQVLSLDEYEFSFGPIRPADGDSCQRCGLYVPSFQTGKTICMSTGWCETCTKTPPFLNGDLLRYYHNDVSTSNPKRVSLNDD